VENYTPSPIFFEERSPFVKILLLPFAMLAVSPCASIADSPSREELVTQIESVYLPTKVLTADSPVIIRLLDHAIAANPGVDDATWQSVRSETAIVMARLLTGKGSILDTQFRNAVESLADGELKSLGRIISDPVYKKFQAAMASNTSQNKILSSSMTMGLQMGGEINSILVSHHLNEVH
jgi:hypothetical protein